MARVCLTEAFPAFAPYGDDFFVTKHGSLLGCVATEGVDFDGLSENYAALYGLIAKRAVALFPEGVSITQFYIHINDYKVSFKERADPLVDRLVKDREASLNKRGLSRSYLYHVYEFRSPQAASKSFFRDVFGNMLGAPFDAQARRRIKARMSSPGSLIIDQRAMERHVSVSKKNLRNIAEFSAKIGDTRVVPLSEFWGLMRYMATLNPRYLREEFQHAPPADDLDLHVADGDVEQRVVDYTPMLKINGDRPRFARVASTTGYSLDPLGYLYTRPNAPMKQEGDYTLINHFAPMGDAEKAKEFYFARADIERRNLSIIGLLKGEENQGAEEGRYKLRREMEELEKAEAQPDRWGRGWGAVVVSSHDPSEVIDHSESFAASLSSLGVNHVWENAGLPAAYDSMQPGNAASSLRAYKFTSGRFGKTSLHYKPSIGVPVAEDLGGDTEPLYVFETAAGEPFYYSPMVGERMFVIAVGPTRSGKTYFKNTVSSHFLKYGGLLRSVDIDAGGKALGSLFTDEAGSGYYQADQGSLNPFVSCQGIGDTKFKAHIAGLLRIMRQANETEALREHTADEARDMDAAIKETMALPEKVRSLNTLLGHMEASTRAKYERWVGDGLYAGILDADRDAVGTSANRIGVWNLQAHRDNPNVLQPLLIELFYRTRSLFEQDGPMRNVPKLFEVDEAHHALAHQEFRDFITRSIRTWGKFGAGMTLWSQGPEDYLQTPGWGAIRSAASTFLFMADPKMDEAAYRKAFPLDDGAITAIRDLVPKKEAYIFQPDIGVGKTVRLKVDSYQHMINTSTRSEVVRRDELIAQHGTAEGLQRAAQEHASGNVVSIKTNAA